MSAARSRFLHYCAFVALYLLLDWATYIDPLYGLNITPWNPDPALGLVFWLRYGRRAALPWFGALLAGEVLVRGMPAGPLLTVLGALSLTAGYGLIGAALRRSFSSGDIFNNRTRLVRWTVIVVVGTLMNGLAYVGLLACAGLIPPGQASLALLRFGTGDLVGVVVSMPLLWMLASPGGRARLRQTVWRGETLGYLALAIVVLALVFGSIARSEFKHFYFLFLPVIWAASRQGLYGTALMVFVLQTGIIGLVKWTHAVAIEVYELQVLDAMLALVGFFIGIVVDEQRKAANELKQSLRLAAAGEMAAALAHELNQPMTALSAYGKACQYLLEQGETGERLRDAIARMIAESGRAAEVVRRLRDFFRTGALQFEAVEMGSLVAVIGQQFQAQCQQHGVELIVEPVAPLTLQADRLQLELVLRNLLGNAFDAVLEQPAGQRSIRVLVQAIGGARLRLTVEDSGKGVSEETAMRLFEAFVSTKASGLGLGLVLSRAIAEAHGGKLWAEVGSHGVFRLVLPLMETGE
ncbi:MASE1 domain-containing protein [Oxalobacteraceae bacterium]|nr:MASE1 domain-containing protein [Oxalobacteraceae bacterium]